MDLNDIWQQNKRWILGVAAGFLLFWIATSIVGSFYNGDAAERKVIGLRTNVAKSDFYDTSARKGAREIGESLDAIESRLRGELVFEEGEQFNLAGKGDPDLHFYRVAREVRSGIVDKAQQFAVELSPNSLAWAAPVGREEIERTLVGLCVLDNAVGRLLDAGDEVRGDDPEAIGLQAIDKFEVSNRGRKSSRRRPRIRRGRRRAKSTSTDVESRVDEFEVSFKFRADSATVQLFLEKCRSQQPVVLLQDGFKIKAGRDPGDPLTVQGRLVAFKVRDAES